jgi:uncharacterized protein (TIGR02246 family)
MQSGPAWVEQNDEEMIMKTLQKYTLAGLVALLGSQASAEPMTEARAADTVAIQQLIVKYAHVYDALDVEGYVSVFTEDAKFTFNGNALNGHADIREFITGAKQRQASTPPTDPVTRSYHSISNTRIEFDSDTRARHRSYWQVLQCQTGNMCIVGSMGYYDDVVVKQNGEWLIQSRDIPQ